MTGITWVSTAMRGPPRPLHDPRRRIDCTPEWIAGSMGLVSSIAWPFSSASLRLSGCHRAADAGADDARQRLRAAIPGDMRAHIYDEDHRIGHVVQQLGLEQPVFADAGPPVEGSAPAAKPNRRCRLRVQRQQPAPGHLPAKLAPVGFEQLGELPHELRIELRAGMPIELGQARSNDMAGRYMPSEVMASNASATVSIRAASGICSPLWFRRPVAAVDQVGTLATISSTPGCRAASRRISWLIGASPRHDGRFLRWRAGRLHEHVVGHANVAHVMQQRGDFQFLALRFVGFHLSRPKPSRSRATRRECSAVGSCLPRSAAKRLLAIPSRHLADWFSVHSSGGTLSDTQSAPRPPSLQQRAQLHHPTSATLAGLHRPVPAAPFTVIGDTGHGRSFAHSPSIKADITVRRCVMPKRPTVIPVGRGRFAQPGMFGYQYQSPRLPSTVVERPARFVAVPRPRCA